jgi:hypothetical protein
MNGLDNSGETMPAYYDTDGAEVTFTLTFDWPRPPLTMNDRLHWRTKADKTRMMRQAASWQARVSRLPADLSHVIVALTWVVTDRRRRDGGENLAPTYKALLDGLVDYGVVVDDDPAHVTRGPSIVSYRPNDVAHMELHIAVRANNSTADEVAA